MNAEAIATATARWLKNRALRYLAQREYSRCELRARVLRAYMLRGAEDLLRNKSPFRDACGRAHCSVARCCHGTAMTPPHAQDLRKVHPVGRIDNTACVYGEEITTTLGAFCVSPDALDCIPTHPPQKGTCSQASPERCACSDNEQLGVEQVHAALDAVLDELQAQAYLCDERFVASRLRLRQARLGAQRIQAELRTHGLALSELQKQALQSSELERARAIWSRKFDEAPTQAQQYAKQARFLQGRGFSSDVIRQVLRAAGSAQPIDENADH
jgi:regulatory protein